MNILLLSPAVIFLGPIMCYHCSTYNVAPYVGDNIDAYIYGTAADIPIDDRCLDPSEVDASDLLVG